MISGHGNSKPTGIFIADAPQGEDFSTGYILTGYQEAMLKEFLREHHLDIREFYRTALIKDKLDSWGDVEKSSPLTAQYSSLLIEEINELKPFLLIPLGELSFHFLTSLSGIRKFRGSILPTNGVVGLNQVYKVLPILGPYPYLYQEYKLKYISRIDFSKIPKYLNDSPIPESVHNIWIAKSSAALRAFLERSYSDDGLLVFDIETYKGLITCISFCFNGQESVCVPILDLSIDLDNRVLMLDLVARILASPIRKVNQNIKYDWKILTRWGLYVNNVYGDTMLATSCLYCEFPKNLGFLTSIYTDLPYFKDEGREFDPTKHKKEQFYLYNAKDSLAAHQIINRQLDEIKEQKVEFVYNNLVKLTPIYMNMEERGIRIDDTKQKELLASYESLYHIHLLKLRGLLNLDYINPLSSQQMNEVVFNLLKYKKIRGVKGSDEESLLLLMVYGESETAPTTGREVLQTISNCRKIHKVIEILELYQYPDSRFRCEFNLAGTETGRTSASKTIDELLIIEKGKVKAKRLGHSLQTIGKHGFMIDGVTYGKDIRAMFVPSRGYSFVECDLSQAEARVDAVLAGNYDILAIFDGPIGIHRLTGSWVYDCDPSEIKKNVVVADPRSPVPIDRYHTAKIVRHAGERNMREDRLFAMSQLPIAECKRILDKFHKTQPEIRDVFHRDIINVINQTHGLIAPNGRRHDFFDRIDKDAYNRGISFFPQAIVTDQTKFYGILNTFIQLDWAYLLTEQHDGVLAEVPLGREEEFGIIYKKNIEVPIDFRTCSLPREYMLTIPCEVAVGDNWQEMREIKL